VLSQLCVDLRLSQVDSAALDHLARMWGISRGLRQMPRADVRMLPYNIISIRTLAVHVCAATS
jgi:hypothetical protein